MTSEQLSAIAGVILSLLFSYVPGLTGWWAKQENTNKRLIMAGLLLVVAVGAYALSCAGVISMVTCNQEGIVGLINTFIYALMANQATYLIAPTKANA